MNQKTPTFSTEIEETIDHVYLDLTTEEMKQLIQSPFMNVAFRTYETPVDELYQYLLDHKAGQLLYKLKRIKAK